MTTDTTSSGRVYDELLAPEEPRPELPDGLVTDIRRQLTDSTSAALAELSDDLVWSKSRHSQAGKCIGLALASAERGFDADAVPPMPVVIGWVLHAAIQASSMVPGLVPAAYVSAALRDVRRQRAAVDEWVRELDPVRLAELLSAVTNGLACWLADWPHLPDSWSPRWEVPLSSRIGPPGKPALVLYARPDLVIGRPRPTGPTMLICDIKSAQLRHEHAREARFHGLVAALRYSVPPWRSVAYSTQSGSWTHPETVTPSSLNLAVTEVAASVNAWVESRASGTAGRLTPGPWCRFCPAADDCPEAERVHP